MGYHPQLVQCWRALCPIGIRVEGLIALSCLWAHSCNDMHQLYGLPLGVSAVFEVKLWPLWPSFQKKLL